ncbi:LuxR C-terminal-related transcriptional regulator [Pannonibacter sp. Pt2-lr]
MLQGVARGQANKEIAAHLGISVRTVESHRLNIRDKVGSGNAAHLYRIAQELRLV